ncbi:MAG: MFS transporter [Alphaproteobacteria bacterium]|nr:MFS transporter [Alphaproteobacteria bacterium]
MGSLSLGPWMAVVLTDAGYAPSTASLLLVALPLSRLVGGPLWAWLADRSRPEIVVRGAVICGALGAAGLVVARRPEAVVVALLSWALSRAPVFPIVDATTVDRLGARYGRVRAVGSFAFLLAVGLGGWLRDEHPAAPVWLAFVLTSLTAALTFALPPMSRSDRSAGLGELAGLLRDPVLASFCVAATLYGAGLSIYDNLFAVRVEGLGLPSWVAGFAIAWAVGVEVVVMASAPRFLGRIDARLLLVVSMAAGVPRLLLTGLLTDPVALVLLQGLHGLHFATFWLGATVLLAERAPPALRHSTQSLLPATAFGAGPVIGLTIAGGLLGEGADAWHTSVLFLVGAALATAATVVGAISACGPRPPSPDRSG